MSEENRWEFVGLISESCIYEHGWAVCRSCKSIFDNDLPNAVTSVLCPICDNDTLLELGVTVGEVKRLLSG